MAVDVDPGLGTERGGLPAETLAALARAVVAAAGRHDPHDALLDLADAARVAVRADVALVRVLGETSTDLTAVAVAGPAPLAAELEGDRLPLAELPAGPVDSLARAPAAVRRAADRAGARSLLLVPVDGAGGAASLELLRAGPSFSPEECRTAELVAAQVALVLRALGGGEGGPSPALVRPALELAGEALAAALDDAHAPGEVVRLAAGLAGARVAILWERGVDGALAATAVHGVAADADLAGARAAVERTLSDSDLVRTVPADDLPGDCGASTTVTLGRPPVGALQLLHAPAEAPSSEQLVRLTTFGVRAAHALRASMRARTLALELQRTRALLAVVAQATAELSVAHTLETAVDRIADLLDVERVAVYLRAADGALAPAAARGLAGPHARLAERLLDLALGPARGRAVIELDDAADDPRLEDAAASAREAGVRSVIAVPLLVRDEVIGLLAVYADQPRRTDENERSLLGALAGQLAVAVQNAQLHERATRLGTEREAALRAERAAARRLGALYEVSRSFAQTMSLGETLNALVRTVVDVLDVDAAVIRMPDERREQLVFRDIHVRNSQLAEPVRALLERSTPYGARSVQRVFREGLPVRLTADEPGTLNQALASFLDKGWTAAFVPIAKPGEVIASLTIFSFQPDRPIADDTIDAAVTIAAQAALAIDNARLYQQQKQFADTMQRSLLPRSRPRVPGLEVGEVYESSARVDVGGDVYDFLALEDGRLAVVLGDVTGHGVDATADMAMAKFVFRSLAREHPEPGDFLAAANDVIVGEIAAGKFITMVYVAVDGSSGEVACATAGHPPPRVVLPGEINGLGSPGLVLGIEGGQRYEEDRAVLPPGAALVLYTDGVVEARSNGELYGVERLDALLDRHRDLPARALAQAVTEDARSFAGGELSDDLAVVVIRRTG
jgi:serine phosphatase RsbU (regulator of sigma subunit)